MAEEHDLTDETLDGVEAELGDEQDDELDQDFNDYAAVDKAKVDAETKAFIAVAEGDVNTVELGELRSDQVGELSTARFAEYLLWRESPGGEPPGDTIDEDPEPGVPIPDWGAEALLSDKDFQAKMRSSYGKAFDIDSAEAS